MTKKTETYEVTIETGLDEPFEDCEVERWRFDGKQHGRRGQPSLIFRNPDGKTVHEAYFAHGVIHRDNGPAEISYAKNGTPHVQMWYKFGQIHREDGPAHVQIDPVTGVVVLEQWLQFDALHRDTGGPADIRRDRQSGAVTSQKWYRHGTLIKPPSSDIEPESLIP